MQPLQRQRSVVAVRRDGILGVRHRLLIEAANSSDVEEIAREKRRGQCKTACLVIIEAIMIIVASGYRLWIGD
jgi:hypothetical protein